MKLTSRSRAWWLVLACLALLLARTGGAHLHLCLDGSEPPASLHLTGENHHGSHHAADEIHSDIDVPLADDLLNKSGKLTLDLPLLLFAALACCLLAFTRNRPRPRDPPRIHASTPALLLPPSRGPPLPAS